MPRLSASIDEEDNSSVYSAIAMEVEEEPVKTVKKAAGRPKKSKADTPPVKGEEEEEEEEQEEGDDDEEEADDEFVVEAIVNHRFDDDGVLKFHVRWKDYPKIADHTWEPEDTLADVQALDEYIESVGGREALVNAPKAAGKKRGRKSITNGASTPSSVPGSQPKSKRARKLESEDPKEEESPEPSKPKLPPGNWEDLIGSIDTMERQVGGLYILLTFKDGNRIKQPASVVYRRCPQKMLQFYESHLTFRPQTGEPAYYEDYKE